MRTFLTRRSIILASAVLLLLLAAKYFWSLLTYRVPLGYDPGIYRYLFLQYERSFPWIPGTLEPWAREQPPGLFLLVAPLLKIGLPVDALVGWIWSAFCVVLPATYAWVIARREKNQTFFVLVLLLSLLSIATWHTFLAMYWKTAAALLFTVLAFDALERRSLAALPLGALVIIIHQQTGLLFVLAVGSWLALELLRKRKKPEAKRLLLLVLAMFTLGALAVIPVWSVAVAPLFGRLFQVGRSIPAGSFAPMSFFVAHSAILLALSATGFVMSLRRERGTLWQFAVLWSAVFVFFRLFFHRRFILQLDFFLLPFAASALRMLWNEWRSPFMRGGLSLLLVLQGIATAAHVVPQFTLWCSVAPSICDRFPVLELKRVDAALLRDIVRIDRSLPPETRVLSLEPEITPWLRGWMPFRPVAGPGIFQSPWNYAGWEQFLLGSTERRLGRLADLPKPLYLFVSPLFREHYGERADIFLAEPCFQPTADERIWEVACP